MFGSGSQEVFLPLPKVPDWPVVTSIFLLALVEDRNGVCFLPALRSLPESPWPFKDSWGWSHDSGQLLQNSWVHPMSGDLPWGPMDFRMSSLHQCSLTCSVPSRVSLACLDFPPGLRAWRSRKRILAVKTEAKMAPGTLVLYHQVLFAVICYRPWSVCVCV